MTMATTTLRHCGMTYTITCDDDDCVSVEGYGLPAIMIGTIEGEQVQWDDDDGEIEELINYDPDLYYTITAAATKLAAGYNN